MPGDCARYLLIAHLIAMKRQHDLQSRISETGELAHCMLEKVTAVSQ